MSMSKLSCVKKKKVVTGKEGRGRPLKKKKKKNRRDSTTIATANIFKRTQQ